MSKKHWLVSAITNAATGEQSAKSVALLIAVLILGVSLGALIVLACFQMTLDPFMAQAIIGIGAALGTVAGGGYVAGKISGAWSAGRSLNNTQVRPSTPSITVSEKEIETYQGE